MKTLFQKLFFYDQRRGDANKRVGVEGPAKVGSLLKAVHYDVVDQFAITEMGAKLWHLVYCQAENIRNYVVILSFYIVYKAL